MFKVSVPGSLMLFGEHAVLQGKMAVVAAINSRLEVDLTPHNNKIFINSSLGNCELNLNNLTQDLTNKLAMNSSLQYVIECIQYINSQQKITKGFRLDLIDGNLKNSVGFGTSAAVVVGVLFVANKFFSLDISKDVIFKQALCVVHKVQDGLGSGADVAASIYGGIIGYQNFTVQKVFKKEIDLTAVYCGYKTKTADVIKIINNKLQNENYKNLYNYIVNSMHDCSKLGISAIEQNDLNTLGKLMNVAHGLMSGLGVVDNTIDKLATDLRAQSGMYGAKISGAGMGDCVIGLGTLNNQIFKEEQFSIKTTPCGLIWL